MTTTRSPAQRSVHRAGAPLLPPALSYAVLTIVGIAVPAVMAGKAPWHSDADLLSFFRDHLAVAHASAFFTFGAAIPLAVATAVSTSRLRTLGLDVPGRMIALLGGAIASALLALSGLSTLAITQPHVADSAPAVRALYGLSFAAGGPGFVAFSGLLLAGVSIAALSGGVLPGWLGWGGLAVAAVSEIASLSVAFTDLDVLLAVGRFGGLAWLVATGLLLPATRRELRERRGTTRAADES
jgi:hypothetical protein